MVVEINLQEIITLLSELIGLPIAEQREAADDYLRSHYVQAGLPKGLLKASYEKFGDLSRSDYVLSHIVNRIARDSAQDEDITLISPSGYTNLLVALQGNRNVLTVGNSGNPLDINSSVGDNFLSNLNIIGTAIIPGYCENGLGDHGYSGRIIACKDTAEGAGQVNYGLDILILEVGGERTAAQQTKGSVIAFGLKHASGLYNRGGVLLNLGYEYPGTEFGTGVTSGLVVAYQDAQLGLNVKKSGLEDEDYETIKETLKKHPELLIPGIELFSAKSPKLDIFRPTPMDKNGGIDWQFEVATNYDFRDFCKVIPDK